MSANDVRSRGGIGKGSEAAGWPARARTRLPTWLLAAPSLSETSPAPGAAWEPSQRLSVSMRLPLPSAYRDENLPVLLEGVVVERGLVAEAVERAVPHDAAVEGPDRVAACAPTLCTACRATSRSPASHRCWCCPTTSSPVRFRCRSTSPRSRRTPRSRCFPGRIRRIWRPTHHQPRAQFPEAAHAGVGGKLRWHRWR